ncbi:MAG: hypothetical protein ACP5QO_00860 [Clostridia bacterium]
METLEVGYPRIAAVVDMAFYARRLPEPDGTHWVLGTPDGGRLNVNLSQAAVAQIQAEWEELHKRGQGAVIVIEGRLAIRRGEWWIGESSIRCRRV